MVQARLTHCKKCADINNLIKKIDCKLTELSDVMYNNIAFSVNKPLSISNITSLLMYKRILTAKTINSSYLDQFTIDKIASRIIKLTIGCKSKCLSPPKPKLPICNLPIA